MEQQPQHSVCGIKAVVKVKVDTITHALSRTHANTTMQHLSGLNPKHACQEDNDSKWHHLLVQCGAEKVDCPVAGPDMQP